jgi:hypothetical protein
VISSRMESSDDSDITASKGNSGRAPIQSNQITP